MQKLWLEQYIWVTTRNPFKTFTFVILPKNEVGCGGLEAAELVAFNVCWSKNNNVDVLDNQYTMQASFDSTWKTDVNDIKKISFVK